MLATANQLGAVARNATRARRAATSALRRRGPRPRGIGAAFIRFRVTGWQLMPGQTAQWLYAWSQVRRLATNRFEDVPLSSGGLRGTFVKWPGINLCEGYNVQQRAGTQGNSIKENRPSYPAGYSLQPFGGGTGGVPGNTVAYIGWFMPDVAGTYALEFFYPNAEDGACT